FTSIRRPCKSEAYGLDFGHGEGMGSKRGRPWRGQGTGPRERGASGQPADGRRDETDERAPVAQARAGAHPRTAPEGQGRAATPGARSGEVRARDAPRKAVTGRAR